MGDAYRIEIEVKGHAGEELEHLAKRLGIDVSEIMSRALAAWLGDIQEAAAAAPAGTVDALPG